MKRTQAREAQTQNTPAPKEVAAAIDQAEVVADFLPPPEMLVPREDTVKVTLNLSRRSVEFFKAQASRQGVAYQQMVRRIADSGSVRPAVWEAMMSARAAAPPPVSPMRSATAHGDRPGCVRPLWPV